jgi:hypothetical protein
MHNTCLLHRERYAYVCAGILQTKSKNCKIILYGTRQRRSDHAIHKGKTKYVDNISEEILTRQGYSGDLGKSLYERVMLILN